VSLTKSFFQRATASLLTYALTAALLAGPVQAQASVTAQINDLPLGANIQVLLKSKQKLRGTRGAVSEAGFTLEAQSGARRLNFGEVASAKPIVHKSHGVRNGVIGVAIGVGVVFGLLFAAAARVN
jgi:hypothetical protein